MRQIIEAVTSAIESGKKRNLANTEIVEGLLDLLETFISSPDFQQIPESEWTEALRRMKFFMLLHDVRLQNVDIRSLEWGNVRQKLSQESQNQGEKNV